MENNKLIALAAIILLLVGVVIYINVDVAPSDSKPSQEPTIQESSTPKTDWDKGVEVYNEVKSTVKEIKETDNYNDSVWKANRKKMWVYQIGLPTTDKTYLSETYDKLKNVSNIKIFQADKKTFILYKDGFTEKELKDSFDFFKSKFKIIDSQFDTVDLTKYCKNRKTIVQGEGIKIKKSDVRLPCFKCN